MTIAYSHPRNHAEDPRLMISLIALTITTHLLNKPHVRAFFLQEVRRREAREPAPDHGDARLGGWPGRGGGGRCGGGVGRCHCRLSLRFGADEMEMEQDGGAFSTMERDGQMEDGAEGAR